MYNAHVITGINAAAALATKQSLDCFSGKLLTSELDAIEDARYLNISREQDYCDRVWSEHTVLNYDPASQADRLYEVI